MAREKTLSQARLIGMVMCNPCETADDGQPRMSERIALAAYGQQNGAAAVVLEIRGMGGEP